MKAFKFEKLSRRPVGSWFGLALPILTFCLMAPTANAQSSDVPVLWMSTTGNISSSGIPELTSWENGEVIQLGNPNLELAPGPTRGTFSSVVNLEDVSGVNFNIDGLHYVTRELTLGTTHTVDLQVGDLLLSSSGPEDFGTIQVEDTDVFLFRPDSPGEYGSGTFSLVLHDMELLPDSDLNGMRDIRSFTLVEEDVIFGDAALYAGDLLFSQRSGSDINPNINFIYLFRPADVGEGTTSGTAMVLINGYEIGIDERISGMELVETETTLGDETLSASELLLSLNRTDDDIGTDGIAADEYDIFRLQVSETTAVSGSAVANAALLMDGWQLGLNTNDEDIDALAIFSNTIEGSADLTVQATVDNPAPNVGDTVIYTVVVTNLGPDATTGVVVQDPIPAGLTFVSSNASQGFYDDETGLWTVGEVADAASKTLTLTCVVGASSRTP